MSATAAAHTAPRVEPIAEAYQFLADPPLGSVRYRVAYGGRDSAKSWSFARALLLHALERRHRILCTREYQASIRESVHHLLKTQIRAMGLARFYDVQQQRISAVNGSEFIFHGLRHDPDKIKSLEGVTICWVEEAHSISAESWRTLVPTIRAEGSEIWVSFNPGLPDDPVYKLFAGDAPPSRALIRRVSYRDNAFLSQTSRDDLEDMRRRDPEAFQHVYEGEPWTRSESQVFGLFHEDRDGNQAGCCEVEDFEPSDSWDGPYFGADWGFARDPTVLVRCWIGDNRLWIDYDERGIGWNLDDTHRRFLRVPGAAEHAIRGDAARPETIHELTRRGLRVEAAPKWPGSVKDGIEHLRTYERIVIHQRCDGLQREAKLYRYKTDKKTGDVLPDVVDAHNHGWDAVRYALQPMIRKRRVLEIKVL